MKTFPSDIQFSFPWRSYQLKVLNELESHLDDNHLNIVAAPGSGKTILGLEVMMRVNNPTLILAPSIAIKNQWLARFTENFLQTNVVPDWISTDIRNPQFLTISTYQGLHAAFSGRKEKESILEKEASNNATEDETFELENGDINDNNSLKESFIDAKKVLEKIHAIGIKTLVIDEAHHLRNAWWKSLNYLKDHLEKPCVVALTATPPYDVSPQEWQNYQNLCGPIDVDISVPELVLEKNLCPHQDFVFLNTLLPEENSALKRIRDGVDSFIEQLQQETVFTELLQTHFCLVNPEQNIEKILETPEYFSSIIIFLNKVGKNMPANFLDILGVSKTTIPTFSLEWAEILLENFLYRDAFFQENHKEFVTELKRKLQAVGAIENRKVFLRNSAQVKKLLKESLNKLNSILEIVKLEHQNLGKNLRMVILTDFIRKEFFPKANEKQKQISKIGVIPIFEKLRQEFFGTKKIAILSGTMVVIPKTAQATLGVVAQKLGIPQTHLQMTVLTHDENFLEINIKGENNQKIVYLITEVFRSGEIEIIVGTKSLLGEGWDAPAVNTLVLASFVGSFMLSNQMRGRAIRVDKAQPDKISNIWHIASVEKNNESAGHDFETLQRRFKSFVGISFEENCIENGFERMGIGRPPFNESNLQTINTKMKNFALNRSLIKEKWETILQDGEIKQLIPEIKVEEALLPRSFIFSNTIFALFWRSLIIGAYFFIESLQGIRFQGNLKAALWGVGMMLLIALTVSLPGLLKALWLLLRNGSVDGNMKQIGNALIKTLYKIDVIKTDVNKLRVIADKNKRGIVFCGLEGGTSYEKSLFLDCLEEIVNPLQNPRYLLVRKSRLSFLLREDFHAVPQVIGAKKEGANFLALMWTKHVGENALIYTRNIEGRKMLLKARNKAMSTSFQKRAERMDSWR